MSKYKKIETEFRSLDSLKKALSDLDITFEIAADPKIPSLHLIGYRGDTRPEQASVVIRRAQVNRFSGGASNDIGFAWDGNCYAAIVSDFDSMASAKLTSQIKQRYALHELRRQARAQGYSMTEKYMPDGTIRLVCSQY